MELCVSESELQNNPPTHSHTHTHPLGVFCRMWRSFSRRGLSFGSSFSKELLSLIQKRRCPNLSSPPSEFKQAKVPHHCPLCPPSRGRNSSAPHPPPAPTTLSDSSDTPSATGFTRLLWTVTVWANRSGDKHLVASQRYRHRGPWRRPGPRPWRPAGWWLLICSWGKSQTGEQGGYRRKWPPYYW